MIISASRRTDIPAFYPGWFYNRIREGFVLVRNPMNFHRIRRVSLSPEAVDGIVLWTKNPLPMMARLGEMAAYPYYFQFTLNPYGRDVEPNIPAWEETLIPAFQRLSSGIGREKVVWRYDPILISEKYTVDFHIASFARMAKALSKYTEKCTISFLDTYRCMEKRRNAPGMSPPGDGEKLLLAGRLSAIALKCGLRLDTCAEEIDLSAFSIVHARCIDPDRLARIGGRPLTVPGDRYQRPACGCARSVDIGTYDTCPGGCMYCYAAHSEKTVAKNCTAHNPQSPLLIGEPGPDDVILY